MNVMAGSIVLTFSQTWPKPNYYAIGNKPWTSGGILLLVNLIQQILSLGSAMLVVKFISLSRSIVWEPLSLNIWRFLVIVIAMKWPLNTALWATHKVAGEISSTSLWVMVWYLDKHHWVCEQVIVKTRGPHDPGKGQCGKSCRILSDDPTKNRHEFWLRFATKIGEQLM